MNNLTEKVELLNKQRTYNKIKQRKERKIYTEKEAIEFSKAVNSIACRKILPKNTNDMHECGLIRCTSVITKGD